jgi:hypothetical protein
VCKFLTVLFLLFSFPASSLAQFGDPNPDIPPSVTPLDDAPKLKCGESQERSFKSSLRMNRFFCWHASDGSKFYKNASSINDALKKIRSACSIANFLDTLETYPKLTCDSSCCDDDICLNATSIDEARFLPFLRDEVSKTHSCIELIKCNTRYTINYKCLGCGEYTLDDLDWPFGGPGSF